MKQTHSKHHKAYSYKLTAKALRLATPETR